MRRPMLPLILLLPLLLAAAAALAETTSERCGQDAASDWAGLFRCFEDLPEDRQLKASAIVSESLPAIEDLDERIDRKRQELQAVTFSEQADAETLPKLGMDLQRLRNELRAVLMKVNVRLQREVGVSLQAPDSRGCRAMRAAAAQDQ